MPEPARHFPPEFLNRVDDIVLFGGDIHGGAVIHLVTPDGELTVSFDDRAIAGWG